MNSLYSLEHLLNSTKDWIFNSFNILNINSGGNFIIGFIVVITLALCYFEWVIFYLPIILIRAFHFFIFYFI